MGQSPIGTGAVLATPFTRIDALSDSVQLIVTATLRPREVRRPQRVRVLVDTGAAVSIVRAGLLSETWFRKAPVVHRFFGAGGERVSGREGGARAEGHVSAMCIL